MDERPGFFRKAWEWISHLHVAAWLFELAGGGTLLAVIGAGGAAYWAYVTQWGYLPIALTFLGVFVAVIWGINGILWMRGRNRPSKARITFDYSYALNLDGIEIGFDPKDENIILQFRLCIRNHANGPVRYSIEKFRTTVEDRFFELPVKVTGVLPRIGQTTIHPGGGFKKEAFDGFRNRFFGTIEYKILYGHPDDRLSRLWSGILTIEVIKKIDENGKQGVTHFWFIKEESDVAV